MITIPRRVALDTSTPCVFWEGTLHNEGYGIIQVDGERKYVHRLAYQLHVGPMPRGWETDHACHSRAVLDGTCSDGSACAHRACWNPAHLEAVSSRENSLRGNHPLFAVARLQVCRAGLHDLTDGANVYTRPDGRRRCRPCQIDGQRQRRNA